MPFAMALGRVNRQLERFLNGVLLLLLASFIVLIVYQIASRNLGFMPRLYWTEEMSRLAFQWMIMLGTAIGVLHADHFVLEAFPRGSRPDRITRVIRDVACLLVGVIFVVFGFDFLRSGFDRIASASQLPMVVTYSTFFVSGLLIVLFSLQRLLVTMAHGVDAMERELDTPSEIDELRDAPPTQILDSPENRS
ncbi:MAG: C4-dicarboxylate ABC transporter permease [Salinicola sp.]|uniref:TRAP transporter small permease n=1 Tax=uncultured Salinicola sp. TaxID=1193542 RepID=UPI000C8BA1C0|nr:TRAP transporter small permease [uncultured Salinicola sp.]MAM55859.1 C4-dicarboxylate ABC transporter permease [Salinicola sp.]